MYNQVFQLADGSDLFLTFEKGQTVVYDGYEYENYEDAAPLFSGHLEDCLDFVKRCEIEVAESILF